MVASLLRIVCRLSIRIDSLKFRNRPCKSASNFAANSRSTSARMRSMSTRGAECADSFIRCSLSSRSALAACSDSVRRPRAPNSSERTSSGLCVAAWLCALILSCVCVCVCVCVCERERKKERDQCDNGAKRRSFLRYSCPVKRSLMLHTKRRKHFRQHSCGCRGRFRSNLRCARQHGCG